MQWHWGFEPHPTTEDDRKEKYAYFYRIMMKGIVAVFTCCMLVVGCTNRRSDRVEVDIDSTDLSLELLGFAPIPNNPVFTGTGTNTWDEYIRERGFILHEDSVYKMWYTGYQRGENEEMHLGYATSADGISWTRFDQNPIYAEGWVEDMMVVHERGKYYMFAEGKGDVAHMLTADDGIHWEEMGPLDIRYTDGKPLHPGPYGTPTVWREDGQWYLFYERDDHGIWLATSSDVKTWTNVQDEPVIAMGPETYDQFGLAVNQVIKHNGIYYAYYHATAYEDWHEWTSCVAISRDLIHWKKYEGNPILRENKSSPILVYDGNRYRLYSMHNQVSLHFPLKP